MRKPITGVAALALAVLGLGLVQVMADDVIRVVVEGQETARLSGALNGLRVIGGKLVGQTSGGKAVIETTRTVESLGESSIAVGVNKVESEVPKAFDKADRLIVSYQGAAPGQQEIEQKGFKFVNRHDYETGSFIVVQAPNGVTAETLASLASDPEVKHIELDQVVRIPPLPHGVRAPEKAIEPEARRVPNDPLYPQLWGMKNINAQRAWNRVNKTCVIVADIDTGADFTHEDLRDNLIPGFNFINNTPDATDDQGHGTHTAGTIAAVGNNTIGVAGVCWRVRVMPLKFLDASGSGYLSNAIRAIDYARQKGARVTSNSWGGGGFSHEMFDAITRANQAGVLFVAASGNSHLDTDVTQFYPACYSIPNIISVAAIDGDEHLAYFSNYGKYSVHIGAPGQFILSTLPKTGPLSHPSGYGVLSGTSMATPHVSGATALITGLLFHTHDDATRLKRLVLEHARKIDSLQGKCATNGTLDAKFIEFMLR